MAYKFLINTKIYPYLYYCYYYYSHEAIFINSCYESKKKSIYIYIHIDVKDKIFSFVLNVKKKVFCLICEEKLYYKEKKNHYKIK